MIIGTVVFLNEFNYDNKEITTTKIVDITTTRDSDDGIREELI